MAAGNYEVDVSAGSANIYGLTGSGSAVFGVFADAASASACAAALSAVYPFAAHVVFTEQEKDGL